MFRPFHHGRDPLTGIADPFSMLRQQIGTVFDQFGGGGLGGWDRQGERGGQGGAGGTVGFGPAIEDFTGAGGATGGREGRAGEGRSVESLGGEVQPRTSLVGDATALGPMLPSVGQLVPRINIDLVEQPDKYSVKAEIPGSKKEDIKLSVENGVLTITAEKKDQHEERKDEKGFRIHRREICYGTVTRAIRLPRDAKAEEVRAKFENGILEIDVPKQEQRGEKKEKGNVNIQ